MCYLLKLDICVKDEEIDYANEKFFANDQELIEDYLCTLYMNGQIYIDYSLVKAGQHRYYAFVNVPQVESIEEKYNNEYVNRSYKYIDIKIQEAEKNISYNPNCNCKIIPYYILSPDYEIGTSSPLICGKCGNEIPLYKIPHLFNEKEHYSLLKYQKIYASVYELYFQSLSDRFTKNQLVNHNSALNKMAFEIREELEEKMGKAVYVDLPRGLLNWRGAKKDYGEKCPKCGKNLVKCEYQLCSDEMLKCNDCRLITDTTE